MAKKFLYLAIIIIFVPLVAGYFWYMEEKSISHNNGNAQLSYFEIVKEDIACNENCFLEYIVMSNGEILEKFIKDYDIKTKNGINMRMASDTDVRMLIERVKTYFKKRQTNNGIECENCSSYHLYYRDSEGEKSYAVIESSADTEIVEIMKSAENVSRKSMESDVEFFHFFYGKKDGTYLDYHIFTNGIVIREIFGKRSGHLMEADIYAIEHGRVDEIRRLLIDDYFNESSGSQICHGKDFLWGYIEIKTKTGYNYKYTCGDNTDNSSVLFNYLYNNYD